MVEVSMRRASGAEVILYDATEKDRFPIGRIRVWPASEDIRKYIKHPHGNLAFRKTMQESVEWPYDAFTKRRLADGTVFDHAAIEPDASDSTVDVPPEIDPGPLVTDKVGMPPPKKA